MTATRKTAQSFRVELSDVPPVVLDKEGAPILNACVHHILFPYRRIESAEGKVWQISGPAIADISVEDIYYAGVPVTSRTPSAEKANFDKGQDLHDASRKMLSQDEAQTPSQEGEKRSAGISLKSRKSGPPIK
jgi:hypothetical protein